jgi:hypothetical protein
VAYARPRSTAEVRREASFGRLGFDAELRRSANCGRSSSRLHGHLNVGFALAGRSHPAGPRPYGKLRIRPRMRLLPNKDRSAGGQPRCVSIRPGEVSKRRPPSPSVVISRFCALPNRKRWYEAHALTKLISLIVPVVFQNDTRVTHRRHTVWQLLNCPL